MSISIFLLSPPFTLCSGSGVVMCRKQILGCFPGVSHIRCCCSHNWLRWGLPSHSFTCACTGASQGVTLCWPTQARAKVFTSHYGVFLYMCSAGVVLPGHAITFGVVLKVRGKFHSFNYVWFGAVASDDRCFSWVYNQKLLLVVFGRLSEFNLGQPCTM